MHVDHSESTGTPLTAAGLMCLFEGLHIAHRTAAVGWPLLWAAELAIDAHLEEEAKG